MRVRHALRRLHIWLAWLVGAPILIWTASGLYMAAVPIEAVRGEHLVAPAPALFTPLAPVPPTIGPRPVQSLTLDQGATGPQWIVRYADGAARRADPSTGRLLPPVTAIDARAIVAERYTGQAAIVAIDRTRADAPPLELRRPVAAWRVSFDDGTRFYLDAATGEILARRTPTWRVFDFLWGLHIMDLQTRDDINNPWLVAFAALATLSVLLALVLLPMAARRKHKP